MYIIRDIFHLDFDYYCDAKAQQKDLKVLADFTGDSHRPFLKQETIAWLIMKNH
ncbi:MAG TPA: hypothetical protein VH396_23565 [Chitinophagaceae bacterium]|jgi:hypothetical protein